MNVADHRSQILICIDNNRLAAAAKQRAIPAVAPIESLRVGVVEVVHDSGQISFRCSKTEMI